jgi:hypothetical protein
MGQGTQAKDLDTGATGESDIVYLNWLPKQSSHKDPHLCHVRKTRR